MYKLSLISIRYKDKFSHAFITFQKYLPVNLQRYEFKVYTPILFIVFIKQVMFTKCASCLKTIGLRMLGHATPKWYSHLRSFCVARAQKSPWCNMFLDNFDQISDQNLPKDIQLQIRNTNIGSEIVEIITDHFQEQTNLFKFCIELFGSYMKLKYSQTINPSKNALKRMANQNQEFSKLIIDLFVLYYGLQDRQIIGQDMFYKCTLPSLAVNLMFENADISATATRTTKLVLKTQIDKIQFQIQRFSTYSTNQIIVNEQLRLNQKTLAYYSVPVQKCEEVPYSGTIQILKQVIRVNSPAQKVRLLEGIQKQIQSSVVQFYRKHGIEFKQINVSPEDLNNILIYILVQSNQPSIFAHIQIASLFRPLAIKGQNVLQNLIEACENLERGVLRKESVQFLSEMESKVSRNETTSTFFDEVTNFDL